MTSVERIVFKDINESVEMSAKVCTDASVKGDPEFMHRLWKMKHKTPFEHNGMFTDDVQLNSQVKNCLAQMRPMGMYQPAFAINGEGNVVGSLRAWSELNAFSGDSLDVILRHLLPDPFHMRKTFLITTNIGVAREILRHRELSFTERSTRYVKEFVFNPTIPNGKMSTAFSENIHILNDLKNHKIKRDEYREILPLGTETRFYVTGFDHQFNNLIKLRDANGAHQGAREIAKGLRAVLNG